MPQNIRSFRQSNRSRLRVILPSEVDDDDTSLTPEQRRTPDAYVAKCAQVHRLIKAGPVASRAKACHLSDRTALDIVAIYVPPKHSAQRYRRVSRGGNMFPSPYPSIIIGNVERALGRETMLAITTNW